MNAPVQAHAEIDAARIAEIATATALTAQMLAAEAEAEATDEEEAELLIGLI